MNKQQEQQFRNILIIDDHKSIHSDFDKILNISSEASELDELDAELFGEQAASQKRQGFSLTHAYQGADGFEQLQQAARAGKFFGAAFVDMRMPPGWDGLETIINLWKIDPDLQVVICTAFSDHGWDEIILFDKFVRLEFKFLC